MLEPSVASEPLSESLAPTFGRDSTRKRKQVNQNTNIFVSELPGESLVPPPDSELSWISPPESKNAQAPGELPSESLVTWSEGNEQLVSSPELENALPASEPPSESQTIVWDGDSVLVEPLVMENALPPSELPSESLASKSDFEEVTEPLVMSEGKAHVPKVRGVQIPKSLTGAALARRLGVSPGSISRNKTKDNFGQWTFQHDPDGISWYFDGQTFQSVVSSLPE